MIQKLSTTVFITAILAIVGWVLIDPESSPVAVFLIIIAASGLTCDMLPVRVRR